MLSRKLSIISSSSFKSEYDFVQTERYVELTGGLDTEKNLK